MGKRLRFSDYCSYLCGQKHFKYQLRMQEKDIIDYSDKSLFEDSDHMSLPDEKEFYTPEEAYELVMSDVQSIYFMKNAI